MVVGMNIRVRFRGQQLWWLKDDLTPYGALAPLHHCDDEGNLFAYFEDSFAHIFSDGRIMRYGELIGQVDDLEIL
jgi:hypothetical protein